MIHVFRIAPRQYINDLSGYGAEKVGGRWNNRGFPMLYCSSYRALSALEVLVNLDKFQTKVQFSLATIALPLDIPIDEISLSDLPSNWHLPYYKSNTAMLGTEWLTKGKNLVLKVPSAVIEEDYNYLINPRHTLFEQVTLVGIKNFLFDNRLLP